MYRIARQSLIKLIVEAAENWDREITYYEFDGHGEGKDLPPTDIFGLVGYSLVRSGEFHDLTFGIAVMTLDDPSLDRSTQYIDWFYERFGPLRKIPVYLDDGTSGEFDIICFDGTSAVPLEQVDARPTASIQVSARLTRAGQQPR